MLVTITTHLSSSDVYGTLFTLHTHLNGQTMVFLLCCITSCWYKRCAVTQMEAKNLYDIFYNDGLFDNSKGTLTLEAHSSFNGNAIFR
jgi:hypothetical protein